MKMKVVWIVVGVLIAVPALLQAQMMRHLSEQEQVAALQQAIDHGKTWFNDPALGGGTTGASCNTCHPNGGTTGGSVTAMGMRMEIPDLRNSAATFPKWKMGAQRVITLEQMNNGCIEMFLQGKPLALDDPKFAELSAYVTSLAKGKPIYPQLSK